MLAQLKVLLDGFHTALEIPQEPLVHDESLASIIRNQTIPKNLFFFHPVLNKKFVFRRRIVILATSLWRL